MNIYAIGTTHKHASLELRERVAFSDTELGAALDALRAEFAEESVVVSTCNRTEIYMVPRQQPLESEPVREWLARWKNVAIGRADLFTMHGTAAAQHLFEVASGIDSQVIGDIQIIGQVRSAYQIARQHGSVGKVLDRLFTTALHTGKRVKSETDLFTGAVSVSYVAVELARKIFYPIADKSTLVVGAGDAGELAARNLRDQGVERITITNRTEERGHELIRRLGFGEWMPLEQLPTRLHQFDIVIVSTGSPTYLITVNHARAAAARRDGEPLLIVDISLPRNVDPLINSIPTIFCKDLNDLTSVVEANVEKRRAELPRAGMIVADELAKFTAWCELLPVTPVIAQLKGRGEEIARAELERNRHRFSPADFEHVEKLVASVVRKIIGLPMAHLLDTADNAELMRMKAEYVKVLFNLNGEAQAGQGEGAIGGDAVTAHGTDTGGNQADRAPADEPTNTRAGGNA